MDRRRFTLRGVDWLGTLGDEVRGVSNAGLICAEDNLEYVCKARWLNPSEPYTPANELLAAFLCDDLQLPIPRFRVIEFRGENYFGSQFYKNHYFINPNESALLYPPILANVLAFDVWVCNTDRHLRNILMIEGQAASPILVIDHGRALYGEAQNTQLWQQKIAQPNVSPFILNGKAATYQPFLNKYIRTFAVFEDMIRRIEGFQEQTLLDYVETVFYLSEPEQAILFAGLVDRKRRFRELMYANRNLFGVS